MKTLFEYIKKHTYVLWVFYVPVYFICFYLLEKRTDVTFHIIHCPVDDMIPFWEYFIIPYYLWFLYIVVVVGAFILFDTEGFRKLAWYLALGMTVFLIVSYVYPNKLMLRPTEFTRSNIFTDLVQKLYSTDTPTNVLPSIHAYNSIAVAVAVVRSPHAKRHKAARWLCCLLSLAIICSTLFLKQHSIIDVISAFGCAILFYIPVYLIPDMKAKKAAPPIEVSTESDVV